MLEAGQDRLGRQELDPRAAASSIASGIPWSRALIAATAGRVLVRDREARADGDGPLDEQADRRVLAERDRVDGRVSPPRLSRSSPLSWLGSGGVGRPGTGYSCSPEMRRTARLVTMTLMSGAARSRSATIGAASTTCSKLSRTSRSRLSRSQSASESAIGRAVALGDAQGARDPRRDEHRVADRLERHEEDAVGEVVGGPGELERQARLAGPARAGQRQQPGRGEQAGGLVELGVAPDEGRQLGRQVVRPRVEGRSAGNSSQAARRPRPGRCARGGQVLEPVLPEVAQRHALARVVLGQVARQARHEDLAAVGDRGDPRGAIDVEPT